MTRILAIAVALIGGVSFTFAAPAAPGGRQAPVEASRPRVLVLPFEELGDEPKRAWVGRAMQQSLVAELTRSGLVSVVTAPADAQPAKDAAAAAKLARDQHAPLAILGSYQLVGDELRVTGQMIESIEGEHIAAIKATGNVRDLFGIQDIIGGQVRRDLQVIMQGPPATQPSSGTTAPGTTAPGDPFGIQRSGPVAQQTPTGSYDGSELQRSLTDPHWQPQYDRYRYSYPPPVYYPPYGYDDYYDWCGYFPWPIVVRPGVSVVPAGPGPTRTDFPQNNYVTQPGQMGRPSGGNQITGPPGQMGRPSGGNQITGPPGQMGRPSGGSSNQVGPSGQSGRTSSGNTMRNASSR